MGRTKKVYFYFGLLAGIMALAWAGVAWVLLPNAKAIIRQRLKNVVSEAAMEAVRNSARDMSLAANRRVAEESAAFVGAKMGMAKSYLHKFALFDASLSGVDPKLNGMYCELDVYEGTTINYIASRVNTLVHGFDSFEGLPQTWRPGFEAGRFMAKELPRARVT